MYLVLADFNYVFIHGCKSICIKPISVTFVQVKVLKKTSVIKEDHIVIGQYVGNKNGQGPEKLGYLDDATVKKG